MPRITNKTLNMIKKIVKKIYQILIGQTIWHIKNRLSLYDKGERVDIDYNKKQDSEKFDIYQKSHLKRYEFVRELLNPNDIIGDFACGTGYGSIMLSERSTKVIGVDINERVIKTIRKRYKNNKKVEFIKSDILSINYQNYFDKIISFETIEHLKEKDILSILHIFYTALKKDGKLIFSVPYMQEKSAQAIKMGFHLTFYIDESKIQEWCSATGFKINYFKYQNYKTHEIVNELKEKDFIICEVTK